MANTRHTWALVLTCGVWPMSCRGGGADAPADERAEAINAAISQAREDRECTEIRPRIDATGRAPGSRQYDVVINACGREGLFAVTCTAVGCDAKRVGRWTRIAPSSSAGRVPELPPPSSSEAPKPPDTVPEP